MKVLMFGWEFPPFNSGGLGTACLGLTKGLSRRNVDIVFVLPKKVDINVDFLKMVYGDDNVPISTQYFVNSLLQGYATSESYEECLSS
ncbi:MAG: glycogen/starch synthase, partial [archaeon]